MIPNQNNAATEESKRFFLANEFTIHESENTLPLPSYPSYLQYGIIGICLSGSAELNIHSYKHLWVKNELVVILPGMLASVHKISADFSANFFQVSTSLFNDVLSGISRFTIDFYFYMRCNYHYLMNEDDIKRYEYFYDLIYQRAHSTRSWFPRLSVINILRILYLDLYSEFRNNTSQISKVSDSRKIELTRQFFLLVMDNYKEKQSVSFYADKLHISAKYLTMVVKEISGRPVKDWITEYTLLEIKALLMDTSLSIQEIANRTCFSNQSSLGRFFRKHAGVSPRAYRVLK